MAKQYKITKIEYNQKMGGKYPGAFLHVVNVENDKPRKDFVFENSKQFKVLQECAVGNIVELKIVKNGDYFNLAKDDDAIILVSKETTKEETKQEVKQEAITPTPTKEYSKYKEDPDKQAAIIRQNALTNATNLVISMKEQGVLVGIDAVKEIIGIAIQFAKYTSGEDMTEYLAEDIVSFDEPPTPKANVRRKPKATEGYTGNKEIVVEPDCGEFGE